MCPVLCAFYIIKTEGRIHKLSSGLHSALQKEKWEGSRHVIFGRYSIYLRPWNCSAVLRRALRLEIGPLKRRFYRQTVWNRYLVLQRALFHTGWARRTMDLWKVSTSKQQNEQKPSSPCDAASKTGLRMMLKLFLAVLKLWNGYSRFSRFIPIKLS